MCSVWCVWILHENLVYDSVLSENSTSHDKRRVLWIDMLFLVNIFSLSSFSILKSFIKQLVKKKLKLRFFFRIKSWLSFKAKKRLVSATFMSLLDYGDVVYMNASSKCLNSLETSTTKLWDSSQTSIVLLIIVCCTRL